MFLTVAQPPGLLQPRTPVQTAASLESLKRTAGEFAFSAVPRCLSSSSSSGSCASALLWLWLASDRFVEEQQSARLETERYVRTLSAAGRAIAQQALCGLVHGNTNGLWWPCRSARPLRASSASSSSRSSAAQSTLLMMSSARASSTMMCRFQQSAARCSSTVRSMTARCFSSAALKTTKMQATPSACMSPAQCCPQSALNYVSLIHGKHAAVARREEELAAAFNERFKLCQANSVLCLASPAFVAVHNAHDVCGL